MSLLGAAGLILSAVAVGVYDTGRPPEPQAAPAAPRSSPTATAVYQPGGWGKELCPVPEHAGARWIGARRCWMCHPEDYEPITAEGTEWAKNASIQECVAELRASGYWD